MNEFLLQQDFASLKIIQEREKKSYSDTNFRKSSVKKWLQILPALNISLPLASRFSAVFRVISLYSTTWYLPSTLQTTPTASVGNAFSTTCKNMKNLYTCITLQFSLQDKLFPLLLVITCNTVLYFA